MQQRATFGGANPGDLEQLRRDRTRRPFLSLKGDRKAVGFVSRLLQHAEGR